MAITLRQHVRARNHFCSELPARCSKRSTVRRRLAPTLNPMPTKERSMKKHYSAWLVASVLSSVCVAGTDPSLGMTATLQAVKPNPSLGDQANLLARLVGSWDVDYTDYLKDGTTLRRTGEFTVGWIMDGRAILVVWFVDTRGTHAERVVFLVVFFFV